MSCVREQNSVVGHRIAVKPAYRLVKALYTIAILGLVPPMCIAPTAHCAYCSVIVAVRQFSSCQHPRKLPFLPGTYWKSAESGTADGIPGKRGTAQVHLEDCGSSLCPTEICSSGMDGSQGISAECARGPGMCRLLPEHLDVWQVFTCYLERS